MEIHDITFFLSYLGRCTASKDWEGRAGKKKTLLLWRCEEKHCHPAWSTVSVFLCVFQTKNRCWRRVFSSYSTHCGRYLFLFLSGASARCCRVCRCAYAHLLTCAHAIDRSKSATFVACTTFFLMRTARQCMRLCVSVWVLRACFLMLFPPCSPLSQKAASGTSKKKTTRLRFVFPSFCLLPIAFPFLFDSFGWFTT